MANHIGTNTQGFSNAGGVNATDGQIIDICNVCYDPTKDNPCGINATVAIVGKYQEKANVFDSGYRHDATLLFSPDPASVVSDVTTYTVPQPYNLPALTGTSLAVFKWGDMVQSPLGKTLSGWKAKKYSKNGNKLIIELIAPTLIALNDGISAMASILPDEFVTLYLTGNRDFHLLRQFMAFFDNPAKLTLSIEYDLAGTSTNVTKQFWQFYNFQKSNKLSVYNNGLPAAITIKTKLLPIEIVQYKREITFNNRCAPITIQKQSEADTVTTADPIPKVTFKTTTI